MRQQAEGAREGRATCKTGSHMCQRGACLATPAAVAPAPGYQGLPFQPLDADHPSPGMCWG